MFQLGRSYLEWLSSNIVNFFSEFVAISQTDKSHQSCEIYFMKTTIALVYDSIYCVYIFLLFLGNTLNHVFVTFPSS